MDLTTTIIIEAAVTIASVFLGVLAALATDRYNEQRRTQHMYRTILRSLSQELAENLSTLESVRPAYENTPWGKSFYLSTISWETAVASGDLSDIIGLDLTDVIASQYSLLMRIRYHVDLLTQLWFAPAEIPGYENIRRTFKQSILEDITLVVEAQPEVMRRIRAPRSPRRKQGPGGDSHPGEQRP